MTRKLLLICAILFQSVVFAQEDAWVFFTDKENVSEAINNPISILTQKAIDRKALHNVPIDARDVPLTEVYITQIANAVGITVHARSKWFNALHIRGTEEDINSLLDLAFVDHVEFANKSLNGSRSGEPLTEDKFAFETADQRIDFTYGETQNQVEMLNVHLLHQANYTGEGITVAVLDAGFPGVNTLDGFQRMRDAGNLLDGYDFVNNDDDEFAYTGNSHGTRVLSTMAGFVQDQFVGTAPDAKFYLFRTEDAGSENPIEESNWVEAAERADSLGVDIINTSLGYKGYDNPDYSHTSEDMNGETTFITRGANIASEKGMLIITSAGNSGGNGVGAPADSPLSLSIGAVDAAGEYASFSSQGSAIQPTQKPDVTSQGQLSSVIDQNGNLTQNNGTSFSSPIIAGAAASLWQAFPEMTNTQMMTFIRESASQFDTPDFFLGYGIPDFNLALQDGLSVQAAQRVEFKVFPNPVVTNAQVILPGHVEQARALVFDILGKLILDVTLNDTNRTLQLDTLSSGLYQLRLEAENASSKTVKLIKQ